MKNPESNGFKLERALVEQHLKDATRKAIKIHKDQILDVSVAKICAGCQSISPNELFECKSCEHVLCNDCLTEQFGSHWIWTMSELSDDDSDNSCDRLKCPNCHHDLRTKKLNRKVWQIMQKSLQIRHECKKSCMSKTDF